MFATATSLITAIALLGHAWIGCEWHRHPGEGGDVDGRHSTAGAPCDAPDCPAACHESDHEQRRDEGRCQYLKPARVRIGRLSTALPPRLFAPALPAVAASSSSSNDAFPTSRGDAAPGVRAVCSVWLL